MNEVLSVAVITLVLCSDFFVNVVGSRGGDGRELLSIPQYIREPSYQYFLTREQRERGLGYLGSKARLKAVLRKLENGEHIHVTTVGGSVTAGLHGVGDGHSWPDYLFNYLNDTYPGQVSTSNGAIPGTISSYMSACVNIHVPKTSDIVLVEYTVNDVHSTRPLFDNEYRRSYERLLRKLLSFPNSPAVILMHSYNWMAPPIGVFWSSIEREYVEFAYYYDLPSLSLKSASFHAMKEGREGFVVEKARQDDEVGQAGKSFFYDRIHPDSLTGLRAMAELAIHLLVKVQQEMRCEAGEGEGAEEAIDITSIPPPMVPGNLETLSDKCFIGINFKDTIIKAIGFEWLNDSKGKTAKYGYISTTAGSVLEIKVDTRASSQAAAVDSKERAVQELVLVQIVHLKSYVGMGAATMKCQSGCKCTESLIDGHQPTVHNTQLYLHTVYVSQSSECIISITTTRVTRDHPKVKIAGIIVSEETGKSEGAAKNAEVVSMVHQLSFKGSTNGIVDIRDKVKGESRL